MGDMNSAFKNCFGMALDTGALIKLSTAYAHHSADWTNFVENLLLLDARDFTHFNAGLNQLTSLTKCFISLPSWIASHSAVNANAKRPF